MRDSIENISLLQKKLNDLQLENQVLKSILDQAGIPYMQQLRLLKEPEKVEAYNPDQGKRIIHPTVITEDMANFFYARFWGRQDVYAKRSENKSTGKSGYYTQCRNFWKECCPKRQGQKMNCKNCY